MTCVTFHTEGDRITGFDSQGHSGYAEEGADIVCAAVTSAIRLVEATLNDVLGLAASVKVNEKDTKISLRLPGGLAATAESTSQALLTGLMVYFTELHDEYPNHIEILEG
ncbi:MAG: ribosomal-processing cysteine protease Prp [Oscillibacter sp.]